MMSAGRGDRRRKMAVGNPKRRGLNMLMSHRAAMKPMILYDRTTSALLYYLPYSTYAKCSSTCEGFCEV